MNAELGMDLFFKKEYMQYTGSFKERGARWGWRSRCRNHVCRYTLAMLSDKQRRAGVIAASAGNHAQVGGGVLTGPGHTGCPPLLSK